MALQPTRALSKHATYHMEKVFENVTVAREIGRQNIKESQSKNNIQHDKDSSEPKFQVSDTVLMSTIF